MILGIDYGLKNIGLATSEGEIAQPLETIKAEGLQETIRKIGGIGGKLGVTKIVIGISEGKSKNRALTFGRKLETVLRLPIEYVDETLSTHEAQENGKGVSGKVRKQKNKEHARAAAIILQRYLDNKVKS